MEILRQVQKINDFLFIIVPGFCPHEEETHCDNCRYSTVKFKKETTVLRTEIQIGYVSCSCLAGAHGSPAQMPSA